MTLSTTKPASFTTFHRYLQYLLDLIIIKIYLHSVSTLNDSTDLMHSFIFLLLLFKTCGVFDFFVNFGEECGIYLEKCWMSERVNHHALLTQKKPESNEWQNARFRSIYFPRKQ